MTDAELIKNEFDLSLLSKNAKDIKALKALLSDFKAELYDKVYPVGSIYISANTGSPEILFGGKWTQIKGKFLLAADDTYTAGTTGGEATVCLTAGQNGPHNHLFNLVSSTGSGSADDWVAPSSQCVSLGAPGNIYSNEPAFHLGARWTSQGSLHIAQSGGGEAHNNMPPYLSVYVWQRTG